MSTSNDSVTTTFTRVTERAPSFAGTAETVAAALGPDNPARSLAVARPDSDEELPHYGVVGDNYTILLTGEDTDGRYALIDMLVPPGGGPPPHRHDFEEMFHVLEGQIDVTFRGARHTVVAGETVNVPAKAPHFFRNTAKEQARMLCMITPPGLDQYFATWGIPLPTRTALPHLDEEESRRRLQMAVELGPRYRIENQGS